jgi:hypothetical protein
MIRRDLLTIPLWHGTAYSFQEIDLQRGRKATDFGQGFYLTSSREQAKRWAERCAKDTKAKEAYLMRYEFSGDILGAHCQLWVEPCANWLHFVLGCRNPLRFQFPDLTPLLQSDIIAGPVADDQVYDVVTAYSQELYGEVGSREAVAMAVRQIKPEVYKDQVCVKTALAASMLEFKEAVKFYVA